MAHWSATHETHRKMFSLIIDEMQPWSVVAEDYAKDLARINRADEQADRGWRTPIRTFGTCLDCLGDGCNRNPAWYDDDECQVPEVLDCETCRGCGLVEIIDRPEPPAPADVEEPF